MFYGHPESFGFFDFQRFRYYGFFFSVFRFFGFTFSRFYDFRFFCFLLFSSSVFRFPIRPPVPAFSSAVLHHQLFIHGGKSTARRNGI